MRDQSLSMIDLAGGVPKWLDATKDEHNGLGGKYFLDHTKEPKYINVAQLADDYGVGRPTMYSWIYKHYGKDYLKRSTTSQ